MGNLNKNQFGPYWHYGGGGAWLSVPHTNAPKGKGSAADYGTDAVSFATPPRSWTHADVTHLDDIEGDQKSDAMRYLTHIGLGLQDFPVKRFPRRPSGAVAAAPKSLERREAERYEPGEDRPGMFERLTHDPNKPF